MKKVLLLTLVIISLQSFGQSVTISPSNNSPMINASGTTNGILIPRMTQAQRTAIVSPAAGLLVYQTDGTVGFYVQKSSLAFATNWELISEGRNFLDTSLSNGDDIYTTNTGKVGIGTPNPSEKLTVQTGTGYGISHTNGSTTVSTYVSSTAGWLGTKSAHPLYFYTNSGNSQMTLSTAGNVGIGITSPNAPLQFSNAAVNRKVVLYDVSNNDHQYYGFGINGSTLRYQVDVPSSNHIFYVGTSSSTSNELMRIQGNGNVGIGTNLPNKILDVNGRMRLRHNGNTSGIWHDKATGGETIFTGLFNDDHYAVSGVNGWKLYFNASNGNIGVNKIPTVPLTFDNTDGSKIMLGHDLGLSYSGISTDANRILVHTVDEDKDIAFGKYAGVNFNPNVTIKGNGIVGIGAATPTIAGLVVDKAVGNAHAVFGSNTTGVSIESSYPGLSFNGYYSTGRRPLANGFVGGLSMNPSTGMVSIYNTATSGTAGTVVTGIERVLVSNTGNVGIGKTPNASIDVARGTGGDGTAALAGTQWVSHFNYSTAENTYIRGGKNAAKVFINDLSGLGSVQVGVSTTPSGYKMSIDGKLIATEIDVLVTPWPDYVFKPSYKLKSLVEVEKFIAQNGHLPNIPKADEIENKSLALGNMAKLQMEKIEELTLYLIEINKRLEKVESENLILKTELKTIKSQN